MRSTHPPSQSPRDPPSRDSSLSQYSDVAIERVINRVIRDQQKQIEESRLRRKREPLPFGASAANPQGEPRQPKRQIPTQSPGFPEPSFQAIYKPRSIPVEVHETVEPCRLPARIAEPNHRSLENRKCSYCGQIDHEHVSCRDMAVAHFTTRGLPPCKNLIAEAEEAEEVRKQAKAREQKKARQGG